MHRTKQVVTVSIVVILMAVLLVQPIKGLINEDKDTDTTESESTQTLAQISLNAKQGLNPSIITEISDLENRISKAEDDVRVSLLKELAVKWDDVNRQAPLAYTYAEIAKANGEFEYWLKAGDTYRSAYTNLQDTVLARSLQVQAIQAYEQALELNPADLNAKTGLGSAYVSGSDNPMAGIALLQEVVRADPQHVQANKNLGLFSMQSRQFDRAIERFKTVVSLAPDAESYFYLATSYENIGLKSEAIAAFEQSKQLAADPSLTQFIDRKIDELRK